MVSVNWYAREGFLPEAICNYLALLGWSPGENRESFTLAEMAAEFDLSRVRPNPAQFDAAKLLLTWRGDGSTGWSGASSG